MKLLHVIARMDPVTGGVCQAVRTMITSLHALGSASTVVSLDPPDASFLAEDPFPTIALGPGRGPWCYGSRLVPWLVENMGQYDALIVHGLWLYHTYAVRKSFHLYQRSLHENAKEKASSPKVFIMPHGMLDPYFQQAAGRKLKALRNWIYWKLVEGKVVNEVSGLLFTCEEERRLALLPFHPYKPKNQVIIGLGVEAPPPYTESMRKAFAEKCPYQHENGYVLFLGRIHNKKGIDILLTAYEKLIIKLKQAADVSSLTAIEHNERSFKMKQFPKLVIAGPGLDSAFGQNIQQSIAESPELMDMVICTGMLTGDAKWGAFYGCEAFVLPSHQENFGIAVVEAMACAKPVLISDKVNIWREIAAAGAGFVQEDTALGTQELLECWWSLPKEQRTEMGKQAERCYKNTFSIGPSAKHLLEAVRTC